MIAKPRMIEFKNAKIVANLVKQLDTHPRHLIE